MTSWEDFWEKRPVLLVVLLYFCLYFGLCFWGDGEMDEYEARSGCMWLVLFLVVYFTTIAIAKAGGWKRPK